MEKLIILLLTLSLSTIFPQETKKSAMFSKFNIEFLGGLNFSSFSGGSFSVEGKTDLTKNLNMKFSLGYSATNKKESYNVKTNSTFTPGNTTEYITMSYNVNKTKYDLFPVSLGFEYIFVHNIYSPYCLFEIGYNYFSYQIETSEDRYGAQGPFKSFEELPAEYKNNPPAISEGKKKAQRIAIGVGTNYKLTPGINLDIRYLYQFNNLITNTNQVLLGIAF
ncbi:MAG: outer membrane beta-barrel protein [Bacteroidota bacterium]|nr:outer membrane beta-barrel protein [Bacteroidota bacterium]